MKVLGIESSCDETAAAVVENGEILLSNVVNSQIDIHKIYGGVVPEVAARSHLEVVNPVINQAVNAAGGWEEIDAIAVTTMPGLIGSLLVGSLAARSLSLLKNKPLFPIHHVEAHVYANFLRERISRKSAVPGDISREILREKVPEFPLLALIVSGGHSQLVLFKDHGNYRLIGQTQDDAVGEAFDKVAKILGLSYPGGPAIAVAAQSGDATRFKLPKAKMANRYDFSFSGLKTAVLRSVQHEVGVDINFPSGALAERLDDATRHDFAASFQKIAVETLVEKLALAAEEFSPRSIVIAGGVAANQELRRQISEKISQKVEYPPLEFCTDNGAMVASLGYFKAQKVAPTDPRKIEVIPSISMSKTAWSA